MTSPPRRQRTSADGFFGGLQRLRAALDEAGGDVNGPPQHAAVVGQVAQQTPCQCLLARNWPAEQDGSHGLQPTGGTKDAVSLSCGMRRALALVPHVQTSTYTGQGTGGAASNDNRQQLDSPETCPRPP